MLKLAIDLYSAKYTAWTACCQSLIMDMLLCNFTYNVLNIPALDSYTGKVRRFKYP